MQLKLSVKDTPQRFRLSQSCQRIHWWERIHLLALPLVNAGYTIVLFTLFFTATQSFTCLAATRHEDNGIPYLHQVPLLPYVPGQILPHYSSLIMVSTFAFIHRVRPAFQSLLLLQLLLRNWSLNDVSYILTVEAFLSPVAAAYHTTGALTHSDKHLLARTSAKILLNIAPMFER